MNKQMFTKGFTIIELLIVIVIIGILATIMVVSYSGITQRANNSTAEDTANMVAHKLESFKSETGAFPYDISSLTTAHNKSYYIDTTTVAFDLSTTQPASPKTVKVLKCGVSPNTTQANISSTNNNIRGARVYFWTYTDNGHANRYIPVGNDTGTGIACPAS